MAGEGPHQGSQSFGGGMMAGAEGAVRGGARGNMPNTVAIIGGGIAGLACALRLAEAGVAVTVIETRRKLGGRATSFVDPRTNEVLDNCQHVVMGCCTNLLDFYARLGVQDQFEWHTATYWANPPARDSVLKPGPLPAPMHFAGSFMRMRCLSWGSKHGIARAMWKLVRMGVRGRAGWSERNFAAFLSRTGQSAESIHSFWDPIVVSACNLSVTQVGAAYAIQVFQEGFLASRRASTIGLSKVPLLQLYDAAEEALRRSGGKIMLGVSALAIAYDGKRATGVVTDEGSIDTGAVVSAVPPDRLERLVGDAIKKSDARLQQLGALQTSPIVGVHLRYPRKVMHRPYVVLPNRATQWLFNKGVDDAGTQHLHAVVSSAADWMDLSEEHISEVVRADIRWALPDAVGVEPTSVRSVKERRATFAARPGTERHRPTASASGFDRGGGVRNLYLAGDWTRTGWPATMEGAVRSGYLAASAIVGEPLLVPDLSPSWLARMAGVAR